MLGWGVEVGDWGEMEKLLGGLVLFCPAGPLAVALLTIRQLQDECCLRVQFPGVTLPLCIILYRAASSVLSLLYEFDGHLIKGR